jgi:hypothetical protein
MIYLIVGILGFIAYCFCVDSHWYGSNASFWSVMCRLFAKHIKLVFKLAFWFIVAGAVIFGCLGAAAEGAGAGPKPAGGGPESEKFFRTTNKATWPLRAMVDGFTAILGALAMLVCIVCLGNGGPGTSFFDRGVFGEYRQHPLIGNLILFALYLLWLWFTAVGVVDEEFGPSMIPEEDADWYRPAPIEWKSGGYVFKDWHGDRARNGYTLAALGTWAVVVAAAAWGVHWLFAGMWS